MKIIIEIELNQMGSSLDRDYLDTFKNKLISKILLVINKNKTSSFYNYWNSSTITTKTNIKIE